jgi:hypothetical protein
MENSQTRKISVEIFPVRQSIRIEFFSTASI